MQEVFSLVVKHLKNNKNLIQNLLQFKKQMSKSLLEMCYLVKNLKYVARFIPMKEKKICGYLLRLRHLCAKFK